MKLDPYLISYRKVNSKCSKDLNVRTATVKLLEENIGENLHDSWSWQLFLYVTPKAQATKAKLDKWALIKLKSFCTEEETTG